MTELPTDESLLRILRNNHVHIIVVYDSHLPLDKLIREVDRKLVRGCSVHTIEPLTMIHSTQRIVFNVMEKYDFTPTNADQRVFEKLAELTLGSPLIIDTTVQLLLDYLDSMGNKGVQCLGQDLQLEGSLAKVSDAAESNSTCDLFDSMKKLFACNALSCEEQLLLNSLATYAGSPVPMVLVNEMSQLITQANHQAHLAGKLHQKLINHKLLLQYPSPVIVHPVLQESIPNDPKLELVYVPQHVAQYLWKDMEQMDKVFALSIGYHSVHQLVNTFAEKSSFVHGAYSSLKGTFEINYDLVKKEWYQKVICLTLPQYSNGFR